MRRAAGESTGVLSSVRKRSDPRKARGSMSSRRIRRSSFSISEKLFSMPSAALADFLLRKGAAVIVIFLGSGILAGTLLMSLGVVVVPAQM